MSAKHVSTCATIAAQVVLHPAFGAPSRAVLMWTWLCVALASAGLVFLYRTTVADPGFLPCARHPAKGTKEVRVGFSLRCMEMHAPGLSLPIGGTGANSHQMEAAIGML